jgi:hypothetical protein
VPERGDEGADRDVHYVAVEQDLGQSPEGPKASIVGHTPQVLMQGRKKSRRRTPSRIPLYSY